MSEIISKRLEKLSKKNRLSQQDLANLVELFKFNEAASEKTTEAISIINDTVTGLFTEELLKELDGSTIPNEYLTYLSMSANITDIADIINDELNGINLLECTLADGSICHYLGINTDDTDDAE